MEIRFMPCSDIKELYLKLAKDYVETLSKYDDAIRWDEAAFERMIWDADFIFEDSKACGFIIREYVELENGKKYLYIAEFYIMPEVRKCGLGFAAVEAYMKSWDGDVFLYVLDHNEPAKGFWDAVEQRLGWKRVERSEIRQEEGCELRIFARE